MYTTREIRPGMDVFTAHGTRLGYVLCVETGDVFAAPTHPKPTAHEPASVVDGERQGPAPTRDLGNAGPFTQGAARQFATGLTVPQRAVLAFEVGRWWGLLGRQRVAAEHIRNVALERIVLSTNVTKPTNEAR